MTEPRTAAQPGVKPQSARQRARAARSAVLAARRERDRKIEDALTAAFDRMGDVRELQLALDAADRDLGAAVAALAELGEKPEAIAEQTELPLNEVRRLLKLAEEAPATAGAGAEPVALAG